jgi:hypothetical protein
VIAVARVNSVAVAAPVEAAPEAEAAPFKASIAVGVPPEAPASVAAPAGEAVVAAEAEEVVVVEEGVEGAAGRFQVSGFDFWFCVTRRDMKRRVIDGGFNGWLS